MEYYIKYWHRFIVNEPMIIFRPKVLFPRLSTGNTGGIVLNLDAKRQLSKEWITACD